jgi:hypothetical protein
MYNSSIPILPMLEGFLTLIERFENALIANYDHMESFADETKQSFVSFLMCKFCSS